MYVRIRVQFKYKTELLTEYSFVGPFQHPIGANHWIIVFQNLDVDHEFQLEVVSERNSGAQLYSVEGHTPDYVYGFLYRGLRTLEQQEATGTTP